jgi:hypothetical protein
VHLHVGPNLREGPTCKGDSVTRPSADGAAESVTTVPTLPRSLPAAFGAGAGVGVLGGLISLGGAEFRLPPLIGVFGFLALQAVIMNKAMSLDNETQDHRLRRHQSAPTRTNSGDRRHGRDGATRRVDDPGPSTNVGYIHRREKAL